MKHVTRFAPYLAVALLSTSIMAIAFRLRPFHVDGILTKGGDATWFVYQFATVAQSGPFGTNPHVSWPLGSNPWEFPQAGIFVLIVGWFAWVIFHVSPMGAFDLTFAFGVIVTALATLFMFRSINRRRFVQLSVVLSIIVAVGPFALYRFHHLNVSTFVLLPIVMGVMLRWSAATNWRSRLVLATLAFLTAAVSPLWWTAVMIVFLVACIPWILALRSPHARGLWWKPLVAVVAGAGVPTLIGVMFAVPGSAKTRFAWDSNRFGGHLVDLLTASPWLNSRLPVLVSLKEGGSEGSNYVGIVGGLLAILSVSLVVTLITRRRLRYRTRVLLGLSTITTLLFVVGGLGNLQAAAGVILGEASPARAWARLIILFALLGAAWILHWLTSRPPIAPRVSGRTRIAIYEVALVGLVALAIPDWRLVLPSLTATTPSAELVEAPSVNFIESTLTPCPVAQLPADSSPNERMWITEFAEVGYRGYVPYILAPEFFWSYGGDITADVTTPVAKVGPQVTDETLAYLKDNGYCALLFDKRMSALASDNKVGLPGLVLSTSTAPDHEDWRYDVFVLDDSLRK